ncbi:MAG: HK97 family phage prohead protease [Proteobacteria bacterium]|nr:HK97 family phage prohead protease [Pseudomonadota bacterium]MBU1739903.1 HK97 family phage prohead protease [Pseudomonadota bacterium]
MNYKTSSRRPRSINDASRTMVIVASDETLDRDGDVIRADGWDLREFKKNPVIPWGHDYRQPPVARANRVWTEGGRLLAEVQFAKADEYPFADTIYRLYKGGYLNAFSVGFRPIRRTEVDRPGGRRGHDIEGAELWEVSAVTMPSNPNALARAVNDGIISKCQKDALTSKDLDQAIKQIVARTVARRMVELTRPKTAADVVADRLRDHLKPQISGAVIQALKQSGGLSARR